MIVMLSADVYFSVYNLSVFVCSWSSLSLLMLVLLSMFCLFLIVTAFADDGSSVYVLVCSWSSPCLLMMVLLSVIRLFLIVTVSADAGSSVYDLSVLDRHRVYVCWWWFFCLFLIVTEPADAGSSVYDLSILDRHNFCWCWFFCLWFVCSWSSLTLLMPVLLSVCERHVRGGPLFCLCVQAILLVSVPRSVSLRYIFCSCPYSPSVFLRSLR